MKSIILITAFLLASTGVALADHDRDHTREQRLADRQAILDDRSDLLTARALLVAMRAH